MPAHFRPWLLTIPAAAAFAFFAFAGESPVEKSSPADKKPVVRRDAASAALHWLAAHQDDDSHWDAAGFSKHCGKDKCSGPGGENMDEAATGFALLSFLAAGQTPRDGRYHDNVKRAVDWILSKQKADGAIVTTETAPENFFSRNAANAVASMALIEAYGMTNDEKLKDPAQRAIDFIVKSQNKDGGWGRSPNDEKSEMKSAGWQVMALKCGKMSDLSVPNKTWENFRTWIESVSYGDYKEKFKNRVEDSPSTEEVLLTTPMGLVCLLFMGDLPGDTRIEEGVKFIEAGGTPNWEKKNFCRWFFTELVMNMVGGTHWHDWNYPINKTLMDNQSHDGHADGSWDPAGDPILGKTGGRVVTTALGRLLFWSSPRYNIMPK